MLAARGGRTVALFALAVLGGCAAHPVAVPSVPEPRIRISEEVHEFGEVEPGADVRHVFSIENRGGQPLVVKPRKKECSCTASVSGGGTIGAGETGYVEVAFDTKGAAGERTRTVTLETNDPERPEIVLALRGTVVADVTVSPEKAFFGRVPRGAVRKLEVDVKAAKGVTIRKITESSPRIKVKFVRMKKAYSGVRLYVLLRPQDFHGPFDDHIVVTTTSKRQPTVEIPVLGFVE